MTTIAIAILSNARLNSGIHSSYLIGEDKNGTDHLIKNFKKSTPQTDDGIRIKKSYKLMF